MGWLCLVWNDARLDLLWDVVGKQGCRTGVRQGVEQPQEQLPVAKGSISGASWWEPGVSQGHVWLVWTERKQGDRSSLSVFTGLEHIPDISMFSCHIIFKDLVFIEAQIQIAKQSRICGYVLFCWKQEQTPVTTEASPQIWGVVEELDIRISSYERKWQLGFESEKVVLLVTISR